MNCLNPDMEQVNLDSSQSKTDIQKEKLYYFENGFLVFTEKYHLQRGYCCKNGCRHCPY